jgi:hypothetical protein
MNQPTKPLPIIAPILTTFTALAELAACFLMVRSAPMGRMTIVLLAEIILIAAAIAQWVQYFRAYVAQQIEERLRNVDKIAR